MWRIFLSILIVAFFSACGPAQVEQSAPTSKSGHTDQSAEKREPIKPNPVIPDLAIEAAANAPVFIRITKTFDGSQKYGQLELFKQAANGQFHLVKTYPVCTYSGALGPKLKEGDMQSPEGFYFVRPGAMNPNSSYHLSFNLGYPNAFDRAHGRTGSFLMVHGECVSIGCYAMGNDAIDEIWDHMQAAFANGQPYVRVHIFPFPMTDENLDKFATNPNHAFWENLKTGWDWFENEKIPPNVSVSNSRYTFAASSTP